MKDTISHAKKDIFKIEEMEIMTDFETGEIKASKKKIKAVTKQSTNGVLTFTKMFYKDLASIYSLSKSALIVFLEMGGLMEKDTNLVCLASAEKQSIYERTKISPQTLYNATSELVKCGLITRKMPGLYMINPEIFAIGNDAKVLQNRDEFNRLLSLKMEITYTPEGREVKITGQTD